MKQKLQQDDVYALVGTIAGLQTFCNAMAGALPPSLAAYVAHNLTTALEALKANAGKNPAERVMLEHTIQSLETVQTALMQAAESGSSGPGTTQH
jgi:hypothetical protein